MALFKKDEDVAREIEEIKQAITKKEEVPKFEPPPLPKVKLAPPPERPRFAPLFVKIDRYKEVLNQMKNIKETLVSLNNLLILRRQIDKLKEDSDGLIERKMQTIVSATGRLDAEFVRPQVQMEAEAPSEEEERMETYVSDLQKELNKLQGKLREME